MTKIVAQRHQLLTAIVAATALLCGSALAEQAGAAAGPTAAARVIEILFDDSLGLRLRGGMPRNTGWNAADVLSGRLEQTLAARSSRTAWERGCADVTEAALDTMCARGREKGARDLYNLNNIFRLRVDDPAVAEVLAADLRRLPGVLAAGVVPPPAPPPVPPDYVPNQQYLLAATNAIVGYDAAHAWRWPGGNGAGVTICDIEYSWNNTHADLTKLPGSLLNSNVVPIYFDHGTAVAGILVADSNHFGTVGIAHGAAFKTCGAYFGSPAAWNIPGALAAAIAALAPGDVILLEQQTPLLGGSYGPVEWWMNSASTTQSFNGVYAAIQTAVANGIHVVEAGGNGNVNMDGYTWYGDSGAIIVGAGGAYAGGSYTEGSLQRLGFSSYGSRFDVQGWGEDVYTTGYGDKYGAEGSNNWYTAVFSGTSSGSATIAGVVACLEGFWERYHGTNCPPWLLRRILKMTGTPQVTPPAGHIGPRPDLRAAFFADTDADGMPDGWEWANGLSPTNAADARLDADGDRMSNLSEFRSGTDPRDVNSLLRLLPAGEAPANTGVFVRWQSVTNRTYAVERASDLLAAQSYAPIATNIAGQSGTTAYHDTNAPSAIFYYRVQARP